MRYLKILIGLMLIASTALAGNNVEIRFNYPDNVIYVGVENTVEVWIENDDSLYAMSLGLEFSGYDGMVNWNKSYGNKPPFNEEGDAVGGFGGSLVSNTDDFDDSDLPDSIIFGGAYLLIQGDCIPPGTLRLCYTLKFTIPEGQPLGSMCVDNIFFRLVENGCFMIITITKSLPIFRAASTWEPIMPAVPKPVFQ